ncbi:MAG TPA: glycosyl hydrolase family 18 protein [Mobilitalea sp.]|nr:glycosyl hydrolase family 18 protein [Mobilitalea sp.]
MDKKIKIAIIGLSAVIIIIFVALGLNIANKLTPSNEVMQLTDYYQVEDSEVMVILQDEVYEKKGIWIENTVYIDYDTVTQKFNHRFYWDDNENILTYTTPTEILRAEAGSRNYSVTKTLNATVQEYNYEIVKVFADKVYVALDFVSQYSDLIFRFYEDPNRVIIDYIWGDYLFTEVAKTTQLRLEPDIKSPILGEELAIGTSLMYVDKEEAPKKGFAKVMTPEGIIGFVKGKHVKKSFYKTIESDYKAPEYLAQTRQGTINLVFHQVFNSGAAGNLEKLIKATKGVTVVSPTWFDVSDVSGSITSLASEDYMEKARELGLEVWGLVGDVNLKIDMFELLSHTSARDKLSDSIIQAALDNKLNGINIDFETITSSAGEHYIQFLRELSVKCRNNGLVLSADNYIPAPYNEYYDLQEQGQILDYIIIMAYNEFTGSEEAGPVSSIGFVKEAIDNTLKVVPKDKTIIAIPFYTKLWKETEEGQISSENLPMTPASEVFANNGIEAKWDDKTGYNYGEYEKDGTVYSIWQEEDKSIEEKMKAIYGADVAGVAAWKLGLEKESVWNVIIKYLNK